MAVTEAQKFTPAFWEDFFSIIGERSVIKDWLTDRLIISEPEMLNVFGAADITPPGGAAAWVA